MGPGRAHNCLAWPLWTATAQDLAAALPLFLRGSAALLLCLHIGGRTACPRRPLGPPTGMPRMPPIACSTVTAPSTLPPISFFRALSRSCGGEAGGGERGGAKACDKHRFLLQLHSNLHTQLYQPGSPPHGLSHPFLPSHEPPTCSAGILSASAALRSVVRVRRPAATARSVGWGVAHRRACSRVSIVQSGHHELLLGMSLGSKAQAARMLAGQLLIGSGGGGSGGSALAALVAVVGGLPADEGIPDLLDRVLEI